MEREKNYLAESVDIEKTKIILDIAKVEYLEELTKTKAFDEKINKLLALLSILLVALTAFSTSGAIVDIVKSMVISLKVVYFFFLILLIIMFLLNFYILIRGLQLKKFSNMQIDKDLFKRIEKSQGIAHANMILAHGYSKAIDENSKENAQKAEKIKKSEVLLHLILFIFCLNFCTFLISFLA